MPLFRRKVQERIGAIEDEIRVRILVLPDLGCLQP